MKKICFLIMSGIMLWMILQIGETINEKQIKPELIVPKIESYVPDQAVFSEEEVNRRISEWLSDRLSNFHVSFEEDGVIQINLSVDEKFSKWMNPGQNSFLQEALKLFENETISCRIKMEKDLNIHLQECTAAGIPIPNSLLEGVFDTVSKKAAEILQEAGIESIEIMENQLRIRGELQQVMGYLNE